MGGQNASEARLKLRSVAGTQEEGEGARRRRFWVGLLLLSLLLLVLVLLVALSGDWLLPDGEAPVGGVI